MLKEMESTASQIRKILSPADGGLSTEAVQALSLHTKYGAAFSDVLKDAKERGNGSLILNLAGDDSRSPINAYLAASQKEKLEYAINAVSKAAGIKEIYVVKPPGLDYTPQDIPATVIEAARSLVLREESALYGLMENGELRSCPLEKEFPSQGYQWRPAITADAETFCRIYEAAKPGYVESKLVVIHNEGESRIAEVKTGTALSELLSECGLKAEKSVLAGGVAGEFIGIGQLEQRNIQLSADWDSISIYGEKDCMAEITRQLAAEAKQASCGKCVLCREGTWHFQAYAQDITDGKAKKEDLSMILDIGPLIQTGAFCSFGQKMARAIVSSIEQNRTELEAHFIKKTCPAGVCKAFAKLAIDPAKCTGCGECMDACNEDAITGKKKFIHIIDTDLCENCGECAKACSENAIVMQDGSIRVPKKPVKVGKFK